MNQEDIAKRFILTLADMTKEEREQYINDFFESKTKKVAEPVK